MPDFVKNKVEFVYQELGTKIAIGISGANEFELNNWWAWFYNFKACNNPLIFTSDTFGYFETGKRQFLRGLFNALQMRFWNKSNILLEGKNFRKYIFKQIREELKQKYKKESFLTNNQNFVSIAHHYHYSENPENTANNLKNEENS